MRKLAAAIDRLVLRAGLFFAALNVVLIGVILLQVALRHLVSGGHQVVLGELEWHLYALAVLFGAAYSQSLDAHVRVDAASRRFSPRARARIEIAGILFLAMPFVVIVFLQGLDYVANSWRVSERSDSPAGLPWRWLIKSAIPASFALLFLSLFARLLRETAFLRGGGERR